MCKNKRDDNKLLDLPYETQRKPNQVKEHMNTCLFILPGIEDQDNWHGKPFGAKSKEVKNAIKALIKNNGSHGITPSSPTGKLTECERLEDVTLSSPPNYDAEQKVRTD